MSLQNLLGIELPILQAPMAGVQDSALAIAVSNAGGLGALPCAMLDANAVCKQVEILRAGTSRPFNLNFFSHTPPVPDEDKAQAWRALFCRLLRRIRPRCRCAACRAGAAAVR